MTEIKLPELSRGVSRATISYWHKKMGEKVSEGEDIVELVTDKATFNMPSPASGTICEIRVDEGVQAAVGDTIAVIDHER